MATLTAEDITIVRQWEEEVDTRESAKEARGGVSKAHQVLLVRASLTAAGATLGSIPAAAFGLSEFEEVSPATEEGNEAFYLTVLDYSRTSILLLDFAGAPQNVSADLQFLVKGI